MHIRSTADWLVKACLVLGALFVLSTMALAADRSSPPDRALYADVGGKVVDDATGAPLAGVPVSLLYETVVTGADGSFLFQKIPMVHTAQVSMRVSTDEGIIIGCTTFDVPVRFYPLSAIEGEKVAVALVAPGVDTQAELRLKTVTIDKINGFCQGCHAENPCLETATFSNVVATGKDMRGIIVKESQLDRVREALKQQGVSKDSYARIRYQDTHPDNMDMTEIEKSVGRLAGLYNAPPDLTVWEYKEGDKTRRRVVCDTCHTRHSPTQQKQFVVMPFEETSELCYQCHQ